jgi:hypothetical protein
MNNSGGCSRLFGLFRAKSLVMAQKSVKTRPVFRPGIGTGAEKQVLEHSMNNCSRF